MEILDIIEPLLICWLLWRVHTMNKKLEDNEKHVSMLYLEKISPEVKKMITEFMNTVKFDG